MPAVPRSRQPSRRGYKTVQVVLRRGGASIQGVQSGSGFRQSDNYRLGLLLLRCAASLAQIN